MRRCKTTSAFVKIVPHALVVHKDQHILLSNEKNKSQSIHLFSGHLCSRGFSALQSEWDADSLIVKCALYIASSGHETTVVADDTDILVLLLHHYNSHLANIYLFSEA